MALSRVVSEVVNVEKCCDLEIGSEVIQGHRKCYHSIDRVWFPSVAYFSNFVPKTHFFLDIRHLSIP